MKFTLALNMGNAAFAENPTQELVSIMRRLANTMEETGLDPIDLFKSGFISDSNGNRVGDWTITDAANNEPRMVITDEEGKRLFVRLTCTVTRELESAGQIFYMLGFGEMLDKTFLAEQLSSILNAPGKGQTIRHTGRRWKFSADEMDKVRAFIRANADLSKAAHYKA